MAPRDAGRHLRATGPPRGRRRPARGRALRERLPAFLDEAPGPVDFLHVDSDLYSSAKTVLELVGPRLRTGSVVHFDEFFNYSGWQRYEHPAWNEYVEETGLGHTYIAFAYNDCQIAARVDTPPGTTSALGAQGAQVAAGDQPLGPAAEGS